MATRKRLRASVGGTPLAPGFTLIELMITLAIALILTVMAASLFIDVRERTIARGAADSLVSAVAQAKLEAARRNDFITVSVRGSGNAWCIGLQSGTTGCDCTSATCNVTQVSTGDLSGARLLAAADFGTDAGRFGHGAIAQRPAADPGEGFNDGAGGVEIAGSRGGRNARG